MSKNVVILGATSGIAQALSVEFAKKGYNLALAARRKDELDSQAKDLSIRFDVKVKTYFFDALDFDKHEDFFNGLLEDFGRDIVGCVIAYGYMGKEEISWKDAAASKQVIDVNLTGVVSALLPMAEYFEKRGKGFISVISSVAGDRGRKKNMTYGSAKAGVTVYVQGLMQRLANTDVKVSVIKPGFVDTRMTYPLGKLPLIVPPEKAAKDIIKCIEKGKSTLYTPWPWQWIMLIIKMVPDFIFKKMKF